MLINVKKMIWDLMFKFFLILLLFSSYIFSSEIINQEKTNEANEANEEEDKDIFIVTPSRDAINSLFKYSVDGMDFLFSFGEKNEDGKSSYIDLKIGPLYEKYIALGYAWDTSARIILPNTKKKFRLFMKNMESEDDKGSFASQESSEYKNQSFVFGIQFVKTFFKHLSSGVSLGARFNSFYPDPFFRLSLKLPIIFEKYWKLNIGNSMYYFLLYNLENKAYLYLSYLINSKTKIMSYNYYRYREYYSLHEVKNGLGIYYLITRNFIINYEVEVLRKKDDLFSFDVSYYYAGLTFKHIFHEDWLYYELKPGFYFRHENNFQVSPRILLYFGIIFRTK